MSPYLVPAAMLEVSHEAFTDIAFTQPAATPDNVVLLNRVSGDYFGSDVIEWGEEFKNVILVKRSGLYFAETRLRIRIDAGSDFGVGVIVGDNPRSSEADPVSEIDLDSNDPGHWLRYDADIASIINGVEGNRVYPAAHRYLHYGADFGIDPEDPDTWVEVFPGRLGDYFGSGASFLPAGSEIIARLTVHLVTDIYPSGERSYVPAPAQPDGVDTPAQGVSFAFDDPTHGMAQTWTRVDDPDA